MLLSKPRNYTGLLKMLSDLMRRIQDFFKPYTLDQFIEEHNPQDYADVQRLEQVWQHYQSSRAFTNRF
jgi:hypothetical protein